MSPDFNSIGAAQWESVWFLHFVRYDIHNILEIYRPHDIWALLYPIAWVDTSHPAQWLWHRLPERVRPFGIHLIGANWSVDEPQEWYGYGFSTIISPEGKVIASAHSLYGSEIIYADIPTALAKPRGLSPAAR